MEKTFPGRLLAIDHGTQVIGLATCDRTGLIATPLQILRRKTREEDFAALNAIITREEVVGVVVGLPPRPPEFVGSSQSDLVRNWAKRLAKQITLPVYFWDEGLSTTDAEDLLRQTSKNRPERVDAYAAAVILQSLLDALREGHPFPKPIRAL